MMATRCRSTKVTVPFYFIILAVCCGPRDINMLR